MFGRKRAAEPQKVPSKPDPTNPLAPPVDLDVPLTNPALVAALQADPADPERSHRIVNALVNSTLMMATQYAHPDGAPPIQEGMLRAGSIITVYSVLDDADNGLLALFTDWDSLRASTGTHGWEGQVMQAVEALGVAQSQYRGHVVVNPHGPLVTLPLKPAETQRILDVVQRT